MIRSLGLCGALLSIVLLMSSAFVSAGTSGPLVPISTSSTAKVNAVKSTVNRSQVVTFLASLIDAGGNDGGSDKDKKPKKPKDPTPEPSTILSFGAALLIGGGVLYSRRLRRNRR
jgi:hypothetical protein